jgi:hypothetical protein
MSLSSPQDKKRRRERERVKVCELDRAIDYYAKKNGRAPNLTVLIVVLLVDSNSSLSLSFFSLSHLPPLFLSLIRSLFLSLSLSNIISFQGDQIGRILAHCFLWAVFKKYRSSPNSHIGNFFSR